MFKFVKINYKNRLSQISGKMERYVLEKRVKYQMKNRARFESGFATRELDKHAIQFYTENQLYKSSFLFFTTAPSVLSLYSDEEARNLTFYLKS